MAVKVGDRVRYTRDALQRLPDGHLMVGMLGTVQELQDTPSLTVKQFAQVEWDEPLLCLPSFAGAKVWTASDVLEVVK